MGLLHPLAIPWLSLGGIISDTHVVWTLLEETGSELCSATGPDVARTGPVARDGDLLGHFDLSIHHMYVRAQSYSQAELNDHRLRRVN